MFVLKKFYIIGIYIVGYGWLIINGLIILWWLRNVIVRIIVYSS